MKLLILIMMSITYLTSFTTLNEKLDYYCLRDEYILKTKNQLDFNNCYASGFLSCVESSIAKKTNRYYHFSNAYMTLLIKKNASSFLVGNNGSDFNTCFNYIKEDGFVFEDDFPYHELCYVNDDNYLDYLNFYETKANKEFNDYLNLVTYSYNELDSIKKHLINHGALNFNITNFNLVYDSSTKSYYYSKGNYAPHASVAIGYDDNYLINGNKGAFIMLNGQGNNRQTDGVYYYPYNALSDLLANKIYGIKVSDMSLIDVKSELSYDIKIANKYKYQGKIETSRCLNNNVFGSLGSVSLISDEKVKMIYKGKKLDSEVKVTYEENKINLDNFDYGSYKIELTSGKVIPLLFLNDLNIDSAAFQIDSSNFIYNDFNITSTSTFDIYGSGRLTLITSCYFDCQSYEGNIEVILDLNYSKIYLMVKNSGYVIFKNSKCELRIDINYQGSTNFKLINTLINSNAYSYSKLLLINEDEYDLNGEYLVNSERKTSISLNDYTYCSSSNGYSKKYPLISDFHYHLQINEVKNHLDISFINKSYDYDGNDKEIQLSNYDFDKIFYSLDGVNYNENKPLLINAGVYHLYLLIQKVGYEDLYLEGEIIINKINPQYESSLTIEVYENITNLSEIKLPDNYHFKDNDYYRGLDVIYYVNYIPSDLVNYNSIYDIPLRLVDKRVINNSSSSISNYNSSLSSSTSFSSFTNISSSSLSTSLESSLSSSSTSSTSKSNSSNNNNNNQYNNINIFITIGFSLGGLGCFMLGILSFIRYKKGF